MISKEDSGSKIDLEEIQESADEEPIVNTNTQQEVMTPVKPDDISLPIRRTSGTVRKPPQFYYGFYIEEDKISDSTLSELDEPANYKEAMASLEAVKLLIAGISASMIKSHSLDFLEAKMSPVYMSKPDVSFALSMTSRHQQNPGEGHWTAIKNIFKYLRNTKDGFLVYGEEEELKVTAVTWKSLKQDTVADFTCESEYIAACEALKEAIWMKNLIGDLGVVPTVQDPIEIFCDNESRVALTKEPKDHGKSNHIE
ncbi:hypothetical protein Tco_0122442 [Tanacetum coccineum]